MVKAFAVYIINAMRGGVRVFTQIHKSWHVIIQIECSVSRSSRAKSRRFASIKVLC